MKRLRILAGTLMLAICSFSVAAAQSSPGLSVSSPVEGGTINGASLTVNFTTPGFTIKPTDVPLSDAGKHPEVNKPGEGHLHFQLDLQPLIVWDKSTPYTFKSVAPGDHQLMVELANNDHASLSPRVMQIIQFRALLPLPTTGTEPILPAWLQWLPYGLILVAALLILLAGLYASGRIAPRRKRT